MHFILRHLIIWIGLVSMSAVAAFMLFDDMKVPQQEVSLKIDISNQVNVCRIDDVDGEQSELFMSF